MSHTILQQAREVLHSAFNINLEELPQFDLREQVLPHDTADGLKHKRHQEAFQHRNKQLNLISNQLVQVLLFQVEL